MHCFKLKKKQSHNGHNQCHYGHNQTNNNHKSNRNRENYDSQDVVFAATFKNEKF
jgi:hypothetical protein